MLKLRKFILFLGDIVFLYLALFLTLIFGFWPNFGWPVFKQHFFPFSLLYVFWLIIFYITGLYDFRAIKPRLELSKTLSISLGLALAVGIAFFYLSPIFEITPKTNLLINIILLGIFLYIWRKIFYAVFSSINIKRVAILGKNPLAESLIREFKNQPHLGYYFVRFLEEKKSLLAQIKRSKINTLIIAKNLSRSSHKTLEDLYQSIIQGIELLDLSEAYETILNRLPIDFLNYEWFLRNLREGEKRFYDHLKRIEDILISLFIILVTSPLWLVIAFLIKIDDRGPVFYKQKRVGKNKDVFLLWKFRSMVPGAEKNGPVWAKEKDPRVTRIGRILRKIHLDELPQMINVLRGDISLVGPRPERPEFVKKLEKEIPHYHLRHIIKPGFTGWAQVKQLGKYARSIKDSHEKFQYDLYYIKNRSFFLDITCLLKTFLLFFE